ncbi:hypothetical protein B0H17DRAFT_1190607 [Mycena rosella]|uniref:C2H2-type domain-containing protein n=1 Tax=Mycena rosella TaxID=1033263 RepID=A0AAD7H3J0_MYCRO|nr:hypothetical protein B0H17DRAFT_1190607 [Mycena rosella]
MSHPTALPAATPSQQDYNMDGGSYTGQFNPAGYSRHFLGSPISWRAGSFGDRYCTRQSPTAMPVGSFHPLKSPQDPSILDVWNVFDRQGELCRNYTCCGTHLPDLHALLDHFEEVHDRSQPPQIQSPFNSQMNTPESAPATPQLSHQQPQYSTPLDPDDMDLGLDYSDAPPPPPCTAPTSTVRWRASSPSPSPTSSDAQRPALNTCLNGVGISFPFREGMRTPLSTAQAPTPFSAYARYSAEYNSPGGFTPQYVADYTPDSTVIPSPELAFVTGEELQSKAKRSPPPPASPVPATPSRSSTPTSTQAPVAHSPATPAAAMRPATTGPSIRRFCCPKPYCSKSYKQKSGLEYHMTRGSCNYGPSEYLEAVHALLERKRATGGEPSQAELNEVEALVRPFACGVGDCTRRYKNMKGLRYHSQHSGDHAAVGLGRLGGGANGTSAAGMAPAASAYVWETTLLPHIQAAAGVKSTATPTGDDAACSAHSKNGGDAFQAADDCRACPVRIVRAVPPGGRREVVRARGARADRRADGIAAV